MNNYKIVRKFVEYLSITISIAVQQLLNQKLELFIKDRLLLAIIALIVIIVGAEVLPILFSFCIERSFLKKIIVSDQYVDGTWLDIMKKDGKPFAVGISKIKINKDDEITYVGTEISLDKGETSTYRTFMAELDWPSLKYTYQYRKPNIAAQYLTGYGELDFDIRTNYPILYNGYYIDFSTAEKTTFEGWKIEDSVLLKKLDKPNERENAIREFLKTINVEY